MRMPRGAAPQRAARLSGAFAPSPMAVKTPSSRPARSAAVRWYALTVSQKSTGLGSGGAVGVDGVRTSPEGGMRSPPALNPLRRDSCGMDLILLLPPVTVSGRVDGNGGYIPGSSADGP